MCRIWLIYNLILLYTKNYKLYELGIIIMIEGLVYIKKNPKNR